MVHTAEEGDKHWYNACKSSHVDIYSFEGKEYIACLDCGHEEIYRNI